VNLRQHSFRNFLICIVRGGIKVHSTLRPLNGLLCQPRVIMIMEKSVEWLAGEAEVLGENLPQCRFVHHKPHILPVREPGPSFRTYLTICFLVNGQKICFEINISLRKHIIVSPNRHKHWHNYDLLTRISIQDKQEIARREHITSWLSESWKNSVIIQRYPI
jgi:hypothetical protein